MRSTDVTSIGGLARTRSFCYDCWLLLCHIVNNEQSDQDPVSNSCLGNRSKCPELWEVWEEHFDVDSQWGEFPHAIDVHIGSEFKGSQMWSFLGCIVKCGSDNLLDDSLYESLLTCLVLDVNVAWILSFQYCVYSRSLNCLNLNSVFLLYCLCFSSQWYYYNGGMSAVAGVPIHEGLLKNL